MFFHLLQTFFIHFLIQKNKEMQKKPKTIQIISMGTQREQVFLKYSNIKITLNNHCLTKYKCIKYKIIFQFEYKAPLYFQLPFIF